ncbi:MAG: pyruvate dehydrogenase (acetyl-transferring), homodimeric type, partial [Rickettsiales bacterium]|nr:pyruvate dehydrogenase (acetyl-transferring), homodimeric type [Rickettsiales bacterium]
MPNNKKDIDPEETQEWLEAIEDALEEHGNKRAGFLLETLISFAQSRGARLPFNTKTPFVNTILPSDEPDFPGDRALERKIKSTVRWNAMAMVTKANKV